MSAIGPSRRFQCLTILVAIGGIADIAGNDAGSTRSKMTHCGHFFAEDQPEIRQSNARALRNRLMAPTVWKLRRRADSIA